MARTNEWDVNKYPALGCGDAYQISCSHSSRSPADRLPRIGVCARRFVRKIYWLMFNVCTAKRCSPLTMPTPPIITIIGQGAVSAMRWCFGVNAFDGIWARSSSLLICINILQFGQIIIFFCFISSHWFFVSLSNQFTEKAHPISTHSDGINSSISICMNGIGLFFAVALSALGKSFISTRKEENMFSFVWQLTTVEVGVAWPVEYYYTFHA